MKKIVIIFMSCLVIMPGFVNASEMGNRLKGRILLQVEKNGEAWYINPDNEERYFLGRPYDAFNVMRNLGLGVSNNDFNSFEKNVPERLSGKILIKVEDYGKAYYINPVDLKTHFLGKPHDAFNVMRNLGLGISDVDLEKITINNSANILTKQNKVVEDSGNTSGNSDGVESFFLKTDKKNFSDYTNSVMLIECYDSDHNRISSGSGSLINFDKAGKGILTNRHVITSDSCNAIIQNDNYFGIYNLDTRLYSWNAYSDAVFVKISNVASGLENVAIPINDLDYSLSKVSMCKDDVSFGDKVGIIGYPAYGEQNTSQGFYISNEIMTEGIVSGFDSSVRYPLGNLPYSNYFISAKIDSGNSGGLALLNKGGNLCFLGIPTWLSEGVHENQGLVQNINNIIYTE